MTQLPDIYPNLKYVYTKFEYKYNALPGVEFSAKFWFIPIILVSVYMAAIYLGTKYMEKRDRFNLRNNLAMWNLFLW